MIRNTWLWICLGVLTMGAFGITTGCNTMEGAGQDIEAAGDAIEDSANDAKD